MTDTDRSEGVLKAAGVTGRTVNVHAHLMSWSWLKVAPTPSGSDGGAAVRRANYEDAAKGSAKSSYNAIAETRATLANIVTDDEKARLDDLDARRRSTSSLMEHAAIHVDEMDEAGLDSMVSNLMDHGDFSESTSVMKYAIPFEQVLEETAEVRAAFPGRFEMTAGVNPRRPGAPALLEKSVREYGALALGEMTATMFRTMPTDRDLCYPLYEKACELGVPMMHDATMPLGYSDPHIFEQLATDFPELQICLGGCGLGVNPVDGPDGELAAPERMLQLACEYSNIWLDLDDWQRRDDAGKSYYVDFLKRALASDAREKVMFGSDYPVFNWMYSEGGWVKAILDHANAVGQQIPLEDLELFFSRNALRFLGLEAKIVA